MPITINDKTYMNLQEAVAWLLANNALPFQSTANYVANTEIAKTSIVNPSPAEIKIGSLVLFADGKVGTVSGITASGFMVGPDATDLSDGVPHVTGILIDASQHLIFTMSEGDPIDAGLIKTVSSFSIDASQHLIVNYNDGTSADLGAIFSGNISISGDLTVTGKINNVANPSVKPIYFHPIWVRSNTPAVAQFTLAILDNDDTPYTWARMLSFLDNLIVGSRLNCSGIITYSSQVYNVICLEKIGANDFFFRVVNVSNGTPTTLNVAGISFVPSDVEDGVNKIN